LDLKALVNLFYVVKFVYNGFVSNVNSGANGAPAPGIQVRGASKE